MASVPWERETRERGGGEATVASGQNIARVMWHYNVLAGSNPPQGGKESHPPGDHASMERHIGKYSDDLVGLEASLPMGVHLPLQLQQKQRQEKSSESIRG